MAWATVAEVYTAVSARMAGTEADATRIGPHVQVLATEATESAKQDIYSFFAGRGYSLTQVDQWDAAKVWHIRVAACQFFRAASANKNVQSYIDPNTGVCRDAKRLLEPEEGKEIALTIGGVDPLAGETPLYGEMTKNASDLALLDDVRDRTQEDPDRQPPNTPGSTWSYWRW